MPGDSFPDVSTGVLAQMQHLVAYSGERVDKPVAPRTREKQDDIIAQSPALRRPVRFCRPDQPLGGRPQLRQIDRSGRRPVPRGVLQRARGAPSSRMPVFPAHRPSAPPRSLARGAGLNPAAPARPVQTAGMRCDVWAASYGGPVSLHHPRANNGTINYTVLQVEAGKEQLQADAYISAHAPNGQMIERHDSRDAAFARAFELCPEPS